MSLLEIIHQNRKPTTPTPGTVVVLPASTAGDTPYGMKALTEECATLAATPEGGRNDQLNRAAFACWQLIAAGQLAEATAIPALISAAKAAGLADHEIQATLRSAKTAGQAAPRQILVKPDQLSPTVLDTETIQQTLISSDGINFWDERPELTHIHQFALSRMTSPWAVLGATLVRAIATTPPCVTLPAIVGGPGSLNLFCALVGPSGAGKGAAENAARDAFIWPEKVDTIPLGSGEGMTRAYARFDPKEKTMVFDRKTAIFTASEIDSVTALNDRRGSTLLTQLRAAFSGETLGFSYADITKRVILQAHTYRLCLTVGVQPEKSRSLLDDADGGTPQRFIWMPATSLEISADPPEEPEKHVIARQSWVRNFVVGRRPMRIPDSVTRVIREARAARARGEGEALDGHALFACEKVAAALAVLAGRDIMVEDDWRLAGVIMAISDKTRTYCRAVLDQIQSQALDARARREAIVAEITEDERTKRISARLQTRIARYLAAGGMTWGALRRKLASEERDYLEFVVEQMADEGLVSVSEDGVGGRFVEMIS